MAMNQDEEDAGGLFMVAVEEVGMPGLWTYVKDVSSLGLSLGLGGAPCGHWSGACANAACRCGAAYAGKVQPHML